MLSRRKTEIEVELGRTEVVEFRLIAARSRSPATGQPTAPTQVPVQPVEAQPVHAHRRALRLHLPDYRSLQARFQARLAAAKKRAQKRLASTIVEPFDRVLAYSDERREEARAWLPDFASMHDEEFERLARARLEGKPPTAFLPFQRTDALLRGELTTDALRSSVRSHVGLLAEKRVRAAARRAVVERKAREPPKAVKRPKQPRKKEDPAEETETADAVMRRIEERYHQATSSNELELNLQLSRVQVQVRYHSGRPLRYHTRHDSGCPSSAYRAVIAAARFSFKRPATRRSRERSPMLSPRPSPCAHRHLCCARGFWSSSWRSSRRSARTFRPPKLRSSAPTPRLTRRSSSAH